jgi:hypothetical protein
MLVRKLAAVAVAASVAFGTAGCTFMTPVATQNAYQPGDGVNVDLGTMPDLVSARNFVYLVNANGTGALIGSLINQGAAETNVTLTAGSVSTSIKVAGGGKVDFGYNGAAALDLGVTAEVGSLTNITVADAAGDSKVAQVPVLDGTFSEYAGLIPASPTPAAKPKK